MTENFWAGFEKQANVVQKVISGSAFKAKQQAILASRQAARDAAKASTSLGSGAQKAKSVASKLTQNVQGGYSPRFQEQTKKMAPSSFYKKEGIGVNA